MSAFESHSQAGQDVFVYETLVKGRGIINGTFLDIGACEPINLSNTYALEQIGWRGLLVDNDPGSELVCQPVRTSPFLLADATRIDWFTVLPKYFGELRQIDYLSLDVNGATLDVLREMPLYVWRFAVITIEHDSYRFGPERRDAMRGILNKHGYRLERKDICHGGVPFEDWWVDR